jgi:hypothetical protein
VVAERDAFSAGAAPEFQHLTFWSTGEV